MNTRVFPIFLILVFLFSVFVTTAVAEEFPPSVPEQMGWVRQQGSVIFDGVVIPTSSCYNYNGGVAQIGRPYIHYGSFRELMGLKRSAENSSTACMMVQRLQGGMAYFWQAWPAQEYKPLPLPGFFAILFGWFS
ncbi:MAG: hypothetical protein O2871_00570 [bacterium]|nr:hypothetical protein [bacterium]